MKKQKFYKITLQTPLGIMIAVSDKEKLHLLEFVNRRHLEKELIDYKNAEQGNGIVPLESIQKELDLYFQGKLTQFNTPVHFVGTAFYIKVWQELQNISCGQTISYKLLAKNIGNEKACRAVARANSCNRLALIVPCHRVINSSGGLGGYAAGTDKKKWLLELEKGML